MDQLFEMLLSSPYGQYVAIIVFAAYVLSHIIQYLPIKWTVKIPDWFMVGLNWLAAKHGAQKSAMTDMKGNLVVQSEIDKMTKVINQTKKVGSYG